MQTATKLAEAPPTQAADPYVTTLLKGISQGKRVINVGKGETIFSQGDCADAIYFVQTGSVKVSIVSSAGKAAVLAMLGPRSYFGEDSLAGESSRMSTVTAQEPSTVFQVEKRAMRNALHTQSDLSEKFMGSLLQRSIDLEEDLADQLFNHSEKRLARLLLKLAHTRESEGGPDATIPRLSHETLAEMVGTTRSRITLFMNKFKSMGLIEYKGRAQGNRFELKLRTARLASVVLRD